MTDKTIEEQVLEQFGYDENINLSPLAENVGLAFNDNLKLIIQKTIELQKSELKDLFLEFGMERRMSKEIYEEFCKRLGL